MSDLTYLITGFMGFIVALILATLSRRWNAAKSSQITTPPTVRNIHPIDYDVVLMVHGGCPDGLASAWLLLRKYPTAYVHFANERNFSKDTRMPRITNKHVIMADWCYDVETLRHISTLASKLIILDHHDTARDWCENARAFADVTFDMTKCGAELCADYVQHKPWWLQHIRDRDLWLWEHPRSKEFGAALFEFGLKLTTLDMFTSMQPADVYEIGAAAIAHEQWALERIGRSAQLCTIGTHRARFVVAGTFGSELGNYILENFDEPIACIARYDLRTRKHFVSLRSRKPDHTDHVNVARICERFGGGGHPCAAGWSSADLSMLTWVDPKA